MTVITHHESDCQGGAGLSVFSAVSTLVVGRPNFLSDRYLVKWLEDETNTDFSQAARLRIQLCGMLLRTEMTLLEPYLFMNVSHPLYWFYSACRALASFRINFQVPLFLYVFLQINGYTI